MLVVLAVCLYFAVFIVAVMEVRMGWGSALNVGGVLSVGVYIPVSYVVASLV